MIRESLDTNVLLRFLLNDVPQEYERAKRLLGREGVVYHVADMVFFEVSEVLRRYEGYSCDKIAESLRYVMCMSNVNCNRNMLRVAIDNYEKFPKLSFADCCIAEYARLNEAEPVWTFDQKFAKQSEAAKLA